MAEKFEKNLNITKSVTDIYSFRMESEEVVTEAGEGVESPCIRSREEEGTVSTGMWAGW